jgi:hypothetical protein
MYVSAWSRLLSVTDSYNVKKLCKFILASIRDMSSSNLDLDIHCLNQLFRYLSLHLQANVTFIFVLYS